MFVLGRERAIDPIGNAVGRNADILTAVAHANTARRPCQRNQSGRDDAGCLTRSVAARKLLAPASVLALPPRIKTRGSRYSCRLRGGPALLASASASARAVSKLVKHAMLASTAARRIL